jgi:hypothetical protein
MAEEVEKNKQNEQPQQESANDKPKPAKIKFKSLVSVGCSIAVASGLVLVLLDPICRPTMGASRSARLRFQQRKAEIERHIQQNEVEEPSADLETDSMS